MKRLEGKVALVTGIGSGIGKGCALMFAKEGASVIGCDIRAATAEKTIAESIEQGTRIDSVHPVDLTVPADVQRYVETAVERHGRIDILVNAAAIPPHLVSIAEMDYEKEWRPTMVGEVDLVFLAIKAVWPHMLKANGGSIINFASVNAFRGSKNFGMVAHCAGKAAVLALSRQVAVEGGIHGIRCNSIAPGMVQTDATATAGVSQDGDIDVSPARAVILDRLLIKRLAWPNDIAYCATYLASDEASWVTGANFTIDGGVTAV